MTFSARLIGACSVVQKGPPVSYLEHEGHSGCNDKHGVLYVVDPRTAAKYIVSISFGLSINVDSRSYMKHRKPKQCEALRAPGTWTLS